MLDKALGQMINKRAHRMAKNEYKYYRLVMRMNANQLLSCGIKVNLDQVPYRTIKVYGSFVGPMHAGNSHRVLCAD